MGETGGLLDPNVHSWWCGPDFTEKFSSSCQFSVELIFDYMFPTHTKKFKKMSEIRKKKEYPVTRKNSFPKKKKN